MESALKTKILHIGGMTCINCQNKIQKKLSNTAGIQKAEVCYNKGTAMVLYDTDIISLKDIHEIIKKLDYEVTTNKQSSPGSKRSIGFLIIIFALYVLMEHFGVLNLLVPSRLADTNMGYGMLFVIGLLTSVHCVAMCGGINLSQCIAKSESTEGEKSKFSALQPTFLYNFGRVISYTVIGFIVGSLGSVITFSNAAQGILKLAAGIFMVIMGINMLDIFPWLRKFNPRMPKAFARIINEEKAGNKSPFIVGLLNGLMPCGSLQAMQIYALSAGSPLAGALSMFLFSLGTVPLMFGLGALSSVLSARFSKKIMTFGAVLIVVLGLSMFSQGWSLSGSDSLLSPFGYSKEASDDSDVVQEDGVQIINSRLSPGRYPEITVQAGTPVKWIIDAPPGSINGCNNRVFINEYGIEYTFQAGENIIEFMPEKTGTFRYSCWMGMIRSTITVTEAGETETEMPETSTASLLEDGYPDILEPIPANYIIPTDELAVAQVLSENDYNYQTITINLTDEGFSPAVAVVQYGMDTLWNINNTSSLDSNFTILIPAYYTELAAVSDENQLYFYPTESFDFSNGDNTFYGYIKVVDDINSIDDEAIKAEVRGYQTLIWPSDIFQSGGGASCH